MLISSPQNKIIKNIVSLKIKKNRQLQGQFIVEGFKPVRDAIFQKKIDFIVRCPELLHAKNLLPSGDHVCYDVPEAIFRKITTMENPEGVLAILPFVQESLPSTAVKGDWMILDKISDPGNAGTMIRSADAFGFKNILALDGCVDLYSPKCIRASMGSFLRVDFYRASVAELKTFCDGGRMKLLGLDAKGIAFEPRQEDLLDAVGLVVGSESHGVDERLLEVIDCKIKIPMATGVESLNAAIASSIMMSAVFQARKES